MLAESVQRNTHAKRTAQAAAPMAAPPVDLGSASGEEDGGEGGWSVKGNKMRKKAAKKRQGKGAAAPGSPQKGKGARGGGAAAAAAAGDDERDKAAMQAVFDSLTLEGRLQQLSEWGSVSSTGEVDAAVEAVAVAEQPEQQQGGGAVASAEQSGGAASSVEQGGSAASSAPQPVVVAVVGEPNVGKSSTMNVSWGTGTPF